MEKTVTVLTPTYNRAEKLKSIFDSLKKQTSTDFKWMIIDDGSTDDTDIIVNEFKNNIKLKYRIKGAVQYIVYGKFAGMKLKNLVFSRGGAR